MGPASRRTPAALAVEAQLFRALAVLRVVVTVATGLLAWYHLDTFSQPVVGLAVLAGLVAWSATALVVLRPGRRALPWLLLVDLAVAVVALALTPLVKGPDPGSTLPGFWVMVVVLTWAVHWHWRGGLLAAVVVAGGDLLVRTEPTQAVYGNLFLLLVGGPLVGYLAESLEEMATRRDEAERAAAAAAERTRLARAVHDGVLQVLSLVQRRGREAGGELAELGRLAGEQEAALRSLIRSQDGPLGRRDRATADLVAGLERLVRDRPGAELVTPGGPVEVGDATAGEVLAVVAECLANIDEHVGAGARAWLLVERLADQLVVSVRDEGPGIPAGRLDRAEADGHLGVSESIRGRMRELGGHAQLTTGSFGTEWELVLPRSGTGSGSGPEDR